MNTIELSDRIKSLPPYIFAEIEKSKEEALAQGIDMIDLGVGDPVFQHLRILSTG